MFEPLNSRLPYIPPPDYTIRAPSRTPSRPPLPKDDHGKPHNYTPVVKAQPSPRRATINEEPEEAEERDRNPAEVQRRVLRMLKEHGVPVFPTAVHESLVANPAQLGPTRAYIKHLENHRKYDTLHSFRSCDSCALCKQMRAEIEMIGGVVPKQSNGINGKRRERREAPREEPKPRPRRYFESEPQPEASRPRRSVDPSLSRTHSSATSTKSPLINGSLFNPIEEAQREEEPSEPEEDAEIIVQRVEAEILASKPSTRRSTALQRYADVDVGQMEISAETMDATPRRPSSSAAPLSSSVPGPSAPSRRPVRVPEARLLNDFQPTAGEQLRVRRGEVVKVWQSDPLWTLCSNAQTQMGWVPTSLLRFESPSGSGRSSARS